MRPPTPDMDRAAMGQLAPEPLVIDILTRGLGSPWYGTAAVALEVQLGDAGVAREALELAYVGLSVVRDAAGGEGPLSSTACAHLARVVESQSQGVPVLQEWLQAIVRHADSTAALREAIALLARALDLGSLRRRGAPVAVRDG